MVIDPQLLIMALERKEFLKRVLMKENSELTKEIAALRNRKQLELISCIDVLKNFEGCCQ